MAIPDGYNTPELEIHSKLKVRSTEFMKQFCPGVLCLQRACCSLVILAVAGILVFTYIQPASEIAPSTQMLLALPTSSLPSNYWQREVLQNVIKRSPMHIEDVVSVVDSGEVLVIVRSFESWPTDREKIGCRFGNESSKPLAVHRMEVDQVGILCGAPPGNLSWDMDSVSIEVDKKQAIGSGGNYQHPLLWKANNLLVYTSLATEQEVVVLVHGINRRQEHVSLEKARCVFDGRFETHIISQAQEIFRCAHPPKHLISNLAGKKVSLRVKDYLLPSLAVYNPTILQQKVSHDICACTMVYNSAKFIREWVHYHAHLGVEMFFLYDNNSEDNLDEVIASLNPTFNVMKQPWPWVKTQEAGFSHCAVMAKKSCKWMLFIDVDEYFFPHPRFLSPRSNSSRLASFITAASAGSQNAGRLGQIITFCYDYGPSGLTSSPSTGITQGYTCRMKRLERHKSIVLLSAIAHSLTNVIHHFGLKSGYRTKKILPPTAVINHYKFQVWDEFKVKFKRRAATYVADWTDHRNPASKDRVPDLGTTAIKPADWETRYCEVEDYRLQNYTRSVFGSYDKESKLHFAWE